MRRFQQPQQPQVDPHYSLTQGAKRQESYLDITSSCFFRQHDSTYFLIIAPEDLPNQKQSVVNMVNRWIDRTQKGRVRKIPDAIIHTILDTRQGFDGMIISDQSLRTPSYGKLSPLKVTIGNTAPSQVIIVLPPQNMTMREALAQKFGLITTQYSANLDELYAPNKLFLAQQLAYVSTLNIQHGQTGFVSTLEALRHSSVSGFFKHEPHGQKIRHALDAMAAFAVLTQPIDVEHCRKWHIPCLSALGSREHSCLHLNPAIAHENGYEAPLSPSDKLSAILEARMIAEGVDPALIAPGNSNEAFIAEVIYGQNHTLARLRQERGDGFSLDTLTRRLQRITDNRARQLAKRPGTTHVLNAMAGAAYLLVGKEHLPLLPKGTRQIHPTR